MVFEHKTRQKTRYSTDSTDASFDINIWLAEEKCCQEQEVQKGEEVLMFHCAKFKRIKEKMCLLVCARRSRSM